jgi:ATP-dependent HslUV protease ATP-binding subunit HslU
LKQYEALLATEGIALTFTPDAVDSIARFAEEVNSKMENIGARRLHTIVEKLLDEISFEGPDLEPKEQAIDAEYVKQTLKDTVKDENLSRYIL